MIYIIAVIFSFVVHAQAVFFQATLGNFIHIKNGREPNAGVALFPMIPFFQFLALGLAWVLKQVMPTYDILAFVCFFLVFSVFWLVSLAKLKAELSRAKANSA